MTAKILKPPNLRLVSSSRNGVVIAWSLKPVLSSSGSSSSLFQRNRHSTHSRSSMSSSDDRKVSRTSLGSADVSISKKSLRTPMESVEDGLDRLDSPIEETDSKPAESKEFYTVQMRDRLLGWTTVYWGYKNQVEVAPLTPGEVYHFRMKTTAASEAEESEWSDQLTAATKDEVIAAASQHRALDQGQIPSARKVLALRIGALEIPNKLGRTPLEVAVVRGDAAVSNMLLTFGADVRARELGSHRTPLMTAAAKGAADLLHILTERNASWSDTDRFGQTALHYACLQSQIPTVKFAIKQGINTATGHSAINIKDKFGWTPLMLAVSTGASREVVDGLLSAGADVNSFDKRSQTILMQAVLMGTEVIIIKTLIEKGANIEDENLEGHTAYDFAVELGMDELLPLLERKKKLPASADHLPKRRKLSQPKLSTKVVGKP